ncbi:hypothetical protein CHLRE_12g541050v5 [Chlamydomonas reinhardtii]|uniref:Uncharacterized protein n=1 Tax=Chlamydomonas reinhardtii TaxID=3055 RepID=A0A2K3D6X6_CHLRE|nr:uncharacterized protein CHLRE_12g541050v5 [Chlamydomonas reinhardtii]PNW76277.1 hypothetical protein CHLRE_12g541050v5 [Chlamydomonas reinhardtii]
MDPQPGAVLAAAARLEDVLSALSLDACDKLVDCIRSAGSLRPARAACRALRDCVDGSVREVRVVVREATERSWRDSGELGLLPFAFWPRLSGVHIILDDAADITARLERGEPRDAPDDVGLETLLALPFLGMPKASRQRITHLSVFQTGNSAWYAESALKSLLQSFSGLRSVELHGVRHMVLGSAVQDMLYHSLAEAAPRLERLTLPDLACLSHLVSVIESEWEADLSFSRSAERQRGRSLHGGTRSSSASGERAAGGGALAAAQQQPGETQQVMQAAFGHVQQVEVIQSTNLHGTDGPSLHANSFLFYSWDFLGGARCLRLECCPLYAVAEAGDEGLLQQPGQPRDVLLSPYGFLGPMLQYSLQLRSLEQLQLRQCWLRRMETGKLSRFDLDVGYAPVASLALPTGRCTEYREIVSLQLSQWYFPGGQSTPSLQAHLPGMLCHSLRTLTDFVARVLVPQPQAQTETPTRVVGKGFRWLSVPWLLLEGSRGGAPSQDDLQPLRALHQACPELRIGVGALVALHPLQGGRALAACGLPVPPADQTWEWAAEAADAIAALGGPTAAIQQLHVGVSVACGGGSIGGGTSSLRHLVFLAPCGGRVSRGCSVSLGCSGSAAAEGPDGQQQQPRTYEEAVQESLWRMLAAGALAASAPAAAAAAAASFAVASAAHSPPSRSPPRPLLLLTGPAVALMVKAPAALHAWLSQLAQGAAECAVDLAFTRHMLGGEDDHTSQQQRPQLLPRSSYIHSYLPLPLQSGTAVLLTCGAAARAAEAVEAAARQLACGEAAGSVQVQVAACAAAAVSEASGAPSLASLGYTDAAAALVDTLAEVIQEAMDAAEGATAGSGTGSSCGGRAGGSSETEGGGTGGAGPSSGGGGGGGGGGTAGGGGATGGGGGGTAGGGGATGGGGGGGGGFQRVHLEWMQELQRLPHSVLMV